MKGEKKVENLPFIINALNVGDLLSGRFVLAFTTVMSVATEGNDNGMAIQIPSYFSLIEREA